VADAGAVEAAAQRAEEGLGPIDVWVNNAMTSVFARFQDVTPEEFRRVTEVAYLGYVYGTMSALRRFRARGRGTVVQVGSALAYRGIPLQSAYCGAKHAIQGFTESVRTELMHDGFKDIHLPMVQLPAMNTPQFEWSRAKLPNHPMPVPPIYQPEVAARAIVWAADHHPREITVGGSAAIAINGDKVLPGVGDWYLAKSGIEAQQVPDLPLEAGRPDNLFEPVPGKHAVHGIFSQQAHRRSYFTWLNTHRPVVAAAAGGLGAAVAAGARALRARGNGRSRARS
jgi:short-subunit dehydrogenase